MNFFRGLSWGLLISLVLWSPVVFAQTFYPADQITVAWDAVSVPTGSTVDYKVYTRLITQTPTEGTLRTSVTTTIAVISFTTEGKYYIGAQSVRKVGGVEVASSGISWSDIAANCQGGAAFGAIYYIPPAAPGMMRKQ